MKDAQNLNPRLIRAQVSIVEKFSEQGLSADEISALIHLPLANVNFILDKKAEREEDELLASEPKVDSDNMNYYIEHIAPPREAKILEFIVDCFNRLGVTVFLGRSHNQVDFQDRSLDPTSSMRLSLQIPLATGIGIGIPYIAKRARLLEETLTKQGFSIKERNKWLTEHIKSKVFDLVTHSSTEFPLSQADSPLTRGQVKRAKDH